MQNVSFLQGSRPFFKIKKPFVSQKPKVFAKKKKIVPHNLVLALAKTKPRGTIFNKIVPHMAKTEGFDRPLNLNMRYDF